MAYSARSPVSKPAIEFRHRFAGVISSDLSPSVIRLPVRRRLSSLSVKTESSSVPANFTATVGAPSISYSFTLTQRHVVFLSVIACSVAVSATWLFFSAIPALLAFKRAAESLEKLMDVTREELPDTMASVRLSGMEISDLTSELSDLGQEITQGVRRSVRSVRVAEERLRSLTNTPPTAASLQEVPDLRNEPPGPSLATAVRGVREGIVKGRAFWVMFLSIVRFSRLGINYLVSRRNRDNKRN